MTSPNEETARGPLPATRRSHVLSALDREGAVRVTDLMADLGVSAVTVRRDLELLEREGSLRRVHGGAVATEDGAEPDDPVATAPIGVLVPSVYYYWPTVVRAMEAEARRRGHRLVLRGSSYDATDELVTLRRMVEREGMAGLIIAPRTDSPHFRELVHWLARSEVPHVLVEREASLAPQGDVLESVVTNRALGTLMAVRHLIGLGHRRLGLVLSERSPRSASDSDDWQTACAELGAAPEHCWTRSIPDSRSPDCPAAVADLLRAMRQAGTTALLVHSDPEALAIVQQAQAQGLAVPRDFSVIAYDDEVAGLASPALTAVRPPRQVVGEAAVDLLSRRLDDPGRPVHRLSLSPQLVLRESTDRPPAQPDPVD
ncbi:MAG: substrate-binding domain-containing protein [Propionibacteriaceae bacterium]|jgi:DNA-binding LacI/PurR family transcriptional regulator|nr:substrate-binding domain-containing protein [Propionibacteriaceae bacterium]